MVEPNSEKVTIIYDLESTWEIDLVTKDLFGDYDVNFIGIKTGDFLTPEKFSHENLIPVVVCFTSNTIAFDDIKNFCAFVKPKIIVHFSDEGGGKEIYNELRHYADVVLRQYNHSHYAKHPNVLTIPLGYNGSMLNDYNGKILLSSKRPITLSFVGDLNKSTRVQDCKTVARLWKMPYVVNNMPPSEMREIYIQSVFVPSFRGYFSLDCFRLYEASICGCIPIVVGSAVEIQETFKHLSPSPPWIIKETWDEAIIEAKFLMNNENLLNERQKKVKDWFNCVIVNLRFLVGCVLNNLYFKKFYSQEGQDRWLMWKVFRGQNTGYFVDIGAHDGVTYNNTKAFEDLGWQGVCIEPLPSAFEKLKKNRKCELLNIGLANEDREDMEFLQIEDAPEMLSGIVQFYDDRHKLRIEEEISRHGGSKKIIKVKCKKFSDVVEAENIDYVSIDVEGAEWEILKSIDFSRHTIKCFSVERNYDSVEANEIDKLLKEKGYHHEMTIGHDCIYVRKG